MRKDWKRDAYEMTEETARRLASLIADDIWDAGLARPDADSPDGDALGAMMRRARAAGIIEPDDQEPLAEGEPVAGGPWDSDTDSLPGLDAMAWWDRPRFEATLPNVYVAFWAGVALADGGREKLNMEGGTK